MRIAIDYTSAVRQRAGIGRYTRNLVSALAAIDCENDYVLLVAGGWPAADGESLPKRFRARAVPLSDRWLSILWQRLRVPLRVQVMTGSIDLFHSPDFVLPPVGNTPSVLTVHDLSFLRVPECFVPGFVRYLEPAVRRSARQANHVLVDSESTARDVVELLGVNTTRISVLYPGVETRFRPLHDPQALNKVRERYGLPDLFVLGLGTLQPRKNFGALVYAFARLLAAQGHTLQIQNVHLVIAGSKGWMFQDLFTAIREVGLERRVHVIGHVDDADLPSLYNLASVFAMPSRYEGFGLPVLEAMACGVPVVASTASALPEVTGPAALLVDPSDIDGLASAILHLLTDQSLRAKLVAAGTCQACSFTWETSANKLLSVYRSVARRQGLP